MTGTPDALAQERARRARNGMTVERFRAVSVTGDVLVTDRFLLVDTTAGSVTLTLPPVDQMIGRVLTFKEVAGANVLTVDGDAANIDGAGTLVVADFATILSDGIDWWQVG